MPSIDSNIFSCCTLYEIKNQSEIETTCDRREVETNLQSQSQTFLCIFIIITQLTSALANVARSRFFTIIRRVIHYNIVFCLKIRILHSISKYMLGVSRSRRKLLYFSNVLTRFNIDCTISFHQV